MTTTYAHVNPEPGLGLQHTCCGIMPGTGIQASLLMSRSTNKSSININNRIHGCVILQLCVGGFYLNDKSCMRFNVKQFLGMKVMYNMIKW